MTLTREENQATSCVGKIRHRSRAAAIVARDAMLRRPNRRRVEKYTLRGMHLEAYHCGCCGHYHLGHRT